MYPIVHFERNQYIQYIEHVKNLNHQKEPRKLEETKLNWCECQFAKNLKLIEPFFIELALGKCCIFYIPLAFYNVNYKHFKGTKAILSCNRKKNYSKSKQKGNSRYTMSVLFEQRIKNGTRPCMNTFLDLKFENFCSRAILKSSFEILKWF